ncbi:unnamed protein product, partial [Durusdinium trenchii]
VIVDSYCTCADIDARAANPDDGRRWAEGVEDQKTGRLDHTTLRDLFGSLHRGLDRLGRTAARQIFT